MDSILSAIGSVFTGGLTGLLGVAVQRYFDYQNKKLDMEAQRQKQAHDIDMKRVDMEIMKEEWASRTQVANIEAKAQIDVADSHAFAASFNEPQRYAQDVKHTAGQAWLMVVLDFIRGIVRPGLTIYLCVLTTLMYLNMRTIVSQVVPLSAVQAAELMNHIINTILYLTTTCLLWWFGVRNKQKGPSTR